MYSRIKEIQKELEKIRDLAEEIKEISESSIYDIPTFLRNEEKEEEEEELISEEYPLGRMVEPYDIEKESNL